MGADMAVGIPRTFIRETISVVGPFANVATHMESPCLSPVIDWQEHFAASQHLLESNRMTLDDIDRLDTARY